MISLFLLVVGRAGFCCLFVFIVVLCLVVGREGRF